MLYFIGQTLDMYGQVGNFLIADTDVVLLQQQRPDLFGTAQGLRIALPHLVVKEIIFRIQHIAGIKPLYKELQVGNKPCVMDAILIRLIVHGICNQHHV